MITKIALHGASGRVGSEIIKLLPEFNQLKLVAALVSKNSSSLGRRCEGNLDSPIEFSCDLEKGISACDAVLDFSNPKATLEMLEVARKFKKPVLIATTGFSSAETDRIRSLSVSTALVLAPNLSLGLNVLRKLSKQAASILGADFDLEILELHHSGKKDAPSGSALKLASGLKELRPELEVITDRSGRAARRAPNELGISSIRGGGVAGEHSVFFIGQDERLELTHRVSSRGVFARGALKVAPILSSKPPGLYDILDLI